MYCEGEMETRDFINFLCSPEGLCHLALAMQCSPGRPSVQTGLCQAAALQNQGQHGQLLPNSHGLNGEVSGPSTQTCWTCSRQHYLPMLQVSSESLSASDLYAWVLFCFCLQLPAKPLVALVALFWNRIKHKLFQILPVIATSRLEQK